MLWNTYQTVHISLQEKEKKVMQLNTECGRDEKVGGILTRGAKMKVGL